MCFILVHDLKCILSQRRKYEEKKSLNTESSHQGQGPIPYDTFSLIKFPPKTV